MSAIAATLNANGVPNPSQADRNRNRHRVGCQWGLTTVRAILSNVKYTGRQVWNRQPARYTPSHLPGPFRTQRWASTDQWVISKQLAHPPLVSEADFIAAQDVTALPGPHHGDRRRYQLVGLLRCGWCGRRLESSWSHGRPAYRCQHGHSSAQPQGPDRSQNVYVREDTMITIVRRLLRDDGLVEIAGQAPWRIAWHLRQSRLVVTCTEAGCSLEPEFPNCPVNADMSARRGQRVEGPSGPRST